MHTVEELVDYYAKNFDRLVIFALEVVPTKQLAEDLVQELAVKIIVNPEPFTRAETVMAYFKTCIINAAKTLAKREGKFTITDPALLDIQRDEHSKQHSQDIDLAIDLQRILAKCSPQERELLELRYVLGYQLNEIADIFDTNANAISQQLFRTRKRLAKTLKKEDLTLLLLILCLYCETN